MQTFLPMPSFLESTQILDNKRLGKQRVECWQILQALTNPNYGWQNHPAVKMWRGYIPALVEYGLCICEEWLQRGYKDTLHEKLLQMESDRIEVFPCWLGDERFHNSHKAALLFKWMDSTDRDQQERFARYSQEWNIEPKIDYYWPV